MIVIIITIIITTTTTTTTIIVVITITTTIIILIIIPIIIIIIPTTTKINEKNVSPHLSDVLLLLLELAVIIIHLLIEPLAPINEVTRVHTDLLKALGHHAGYHWLEMDVCHQRNVIPARHQQQMQRQHASCVECDVTFPVPSCYAAKTVMLSATRGMSYLQPINNRCKVSMFVCGLRLCKLPSSWLLCWQRQMFCPIPKNIIAPASHQQQMKHQHDFCVDCV